ncbi:hypothetical protein H5410_027971 [Solanum commersonii]|uniref:Uncharacterized protein n=1 Tax=Solanum commersonii TaxID=4109 RepID=A0A9J5Z3M4_SOLCO|nr:hypothetical protein H5410_027971 [Solanum commersonii]
MANVNGKTPNNYGHIRLFSSGEMKKFGLCLLYKNEPELCSRIRRSRYADSEHHEDASSPSSKKQRSQSKLEDGTLGTLSMKGLGNMFSEKGTRERTWCETVKEARERKAGEVEVRSPL